MTENQDKGYGYVKEDISSLRRDVLNIEAAVSTKAERSASHLAIQTTLIVLALLAQIGILAVVFFSSNGTSELKQATDEIRKDMQADREGASKKLGEAISQVELLKSQRDDVAKQLAEAKASILELRTEIEMSRTGSEKEVLELRRKSADLADKCEMLEKKAGRADAVGAELEALKQSTDAKIDEYETTIADLQKKIEKLEAYIRQGVSQPTPTPTSVIKSAVPTSSPTESLSPDDIKRRKERERDELE